MMTSSTRAAINIGNWVMAASSALGFALSIFNFFWPDSGIYGAGGALVVIVSSALILAAALLMTLDLSLPRWLRTAIDALLFLGIALTGFAAYMLEAHLLLGLMVLALIGWFVHLFARSGDVRRATDMQPGAAS